MVDPPQDEECRAGTGATVAQVPEPRPKLEHTNRSQHGKHLPGPHTVVWVPRRLIVEYGPAVTSCLLIANMTFRVPPKGIEPSTLSLEVTCSIH